MKKIKSKFLNLISKNISDTNKENEAKISLNIDKDSNPVNANHENCYRPDDDKLWCKECVPSCIIEGWTSGNSEIDEFIKDTIYNAKGNRVYDDNNNYISYFPLFLEWVPFDRFEDIKPIGEGGFAKVYSANWIDGQAKYTRQDHGTWERLDPEPIYVALKRLNGSQNMSSEYLTKVFKIQFFNY